MTIRPFRGLVLVSIVLIAAQTGPTLAQCMDCDFGPGGTAWCVSAPLGWYGCTNMLNERMCELHGDGCNGFPTPQPEPIPFPEPVALNLTVWGASGGSVAAFPFVDAPGSVEQTRILLAQRTGLPEEGVELMDAVFIYLSGAMPGDPNLGLGGMAGTGMLLNATPSSDASVDLKICGFELGGSMIAVAGDAALEEHESLSVVAASSNGSHVIVSARVVPMGGLSPAELRAAQENFFAEASALIGMYRWEVHPSLAPQACE